MPRLGLHPRLFQSTPGFPLSSLPGDVGDVFPLSKIGGVLERHPYRRRSITCFFPPQVKSLGSRNCLSFFLFGMGAPSLLPCSWRVWRCAVFFPPLWPKGKGRGFFFSPFLTGRLGFLGGKQVLGFTSPCEGFVGDSLSRQCGRIMSSLFFFSMGRARRGRLRGPPPPFSPLPGRASRVLLLLLLLGVEGSRLWSASLLSFSGDQRLGRRFPSFRIGEIAERTH